MLFPEQQKEVDAALKKLEEAINREFPIGSEVTLSTGRGRFEGVVAGPAKGENVCVKSHRGSRIHLRHYSDVEHK